jgi:hypothetical protein
MSSHPTRLHARAHLLGGRITLELLDTRKSVRLE